MAVGSLPANGFGLHEMHGNVWEWCADVYGYDFYSSSGAAGQDPPCLSGSAYRVRRGGAWYFAAEFCRSANRDLCPGNVYNCNVGVRPSFSPLT